MIDSLGEEFKHFSTELEYLMRHKPVWRQTAQGILFQDGDIVENGEAPTRPPGRPANRARFEREVGGTDDEAIGAAHAAVVQLASGDTGGRRRPRGRMTAEWAQVLRPQRAPSTVGRTARSWVRKADRNTFIRRGWFARALANEAKGIVTSKEGATELHRQDVVAQSFALEALVPQLPSLCMVRREGLAPLSSGNTEM